MNQLLKNNYEIESNKIILFPNNFLLAPMETMLNIQSHFSIYVHGEWGITTVKGHGKIDQIRKISHGK